MECKICGNQHSNYSFTAFEKMLGIGTHFEYFECNSCKCIQIVDIPENITDYYPKNYYSYKNIKIGLKNGLKRFVKRKITEHRIVIWNPIGSTLTNLFPVNLPWLQKAIVNLDSRILDVGCGNGELLIRMYNEGFTNLTGVDPYIKHEIRYPKGITVYKKDITEIKGKFDLIMAHHSFEHMADPLHFLEYCFQLLNRNGFLLIRIPVADCYAWKRYGINWVQLDAPRHFFLHTVQSMKILSEKSNFTIKDVIYDSTAFQFWGSEIYEKGDNLNEKRNHFSPKEIVEFSKLANTLNSQGAGDSACFYLQKLRIE